MKPFIRRNRVSNHFAGSSRLSYSTLEQQIITRRNTDINQRAARSRQKPHSAVEYAVAADVAKTCPASSSNAASVEELIVRDNRYKTRASEMAKPLSARNEGLNRRIAGKDWSIYCSENSPDSVGRSLESENQT
jgi:hypothetical protein